MPLPEERLEELLERLERERKEADELYNAALTGLDGSLQPIPPRPDPPPEFDEAQVNSINLAWDILPSGPPAIDGSLKGRLRGLIWRMVGPALEQQKGFNSALVDHLNRNLVNRRETGRALTTLMAMTHEHLEGLVNFQNHLIRYLQSITLYVDTKDRASAGQAQVLNAAIGVLTDDWLKRWESLAAREQRFNARVGALDDLRATVALAQQTSLALKREVERLLAGTTGTTGTRNELAPANIPRQAEARSSFDVPVVPVVPVVPTADLDSFKYLGFEDAFRGSQTEIRDRLAEYVPLFAGASDVLDLGCGRGEFLDLLRERGITARGLDLNHEMVEVSRGRGLEVAEGDALSYLTTLDDRSLGGVFAAQVVEHLEPSYLMRLIETTYHKLRPGGVIVLETINPACWLAFFESYIRDLTHVRPLHPETLQYLVRVSGFQPVQIEYKSPVDESERLQTAGVPSPEAVPALIALAETFNENVTKLNARLFTYQDYAVVGRKQPATDH